MSEVNMDKFTYPAIAVLIAIFMVGLGFMSWARSKEIHECRITAIDSGLSADEIVRICE